MSYFSDLFEPETGVWRVLSKCEKPIALYGMGDGADKVLSAFERFGIKPAAVMASDDFVRGQSFHGFRVKRLGELEAELGEFTVALCFASQLPGVIASIKNVASRHRLLVPTVPVFGDTLFDGDFIHDNLQQIEAAFGLFGDDLSRRVYTSVLNFYHTGDISLLDAITTPKSEAFESILKIGDNEFYLDLGAYNGDTIDEFLRFGGGAYRKILALEPNAKNYSKLCARCGNMERTRLLQLGAWSCDTTLLFNNKAGRNSAIAEKGTETRVAAMDSLLDGEKPDYIKADVEGAEYETLTGLKNTLAHCKPKLNFSAYHRFEDLFRLPLLIKELNPDYKIYLRRHPYIPAWDTNLYCV